MVNLIGEDAANVTNEEGCRALLSVPGAILHLYGKPKTRPRRKMGHVTFLSPDASSARMKAAQLRERLHELRET
jgi:phosphoribosylaminoimidazole carboxylase (NCAIR synthetase)